MSNASLAGTLAIVMFATAHVSLVQSQSIGAATLPLPESMRGGAEVVQLDEAGQPKVLRKGTNGMVCIADKPGDDEFDVRCYQKDFIQVVYHAYPAPSSAKVAEEIKAGKLKLSNVPTAGYRCLGPAAGYDSSTNRVTADVECWESIHFPFRTAQQIGLPEEADVPESLQRTVPYVMASGRYWSHVMIRHPTIK